jgi:hypothetical protein
MEASKIIGNLLSCLLEHSFRDASVTPDRPDLGS